MMAEVCAPLDCDILEFSFILKSMGFQLKSFEFTKPADSTEKTIEININCSASGLKTKFVLDSGKCSCPKKQLENNNSFWEIEGRAPPSPSKAKPSIVKDASCNILPETNRKTSNLARKTLLILLQHYRSDLENTEKFKNSEGKKLLDGQNDLSCGSDVSPIDQKKTEGNVTYFSTPLNIDTGEKQLTKNFNIPPINFIENENPKQIGTGDHTSPRSAKGALLFPSPQFNKDENDRDIFIIESIQNARKELDVALLHLKCNMTRDITGNSTEIETPKNSEMVSIIQNEQVQQEPVKSSAKRRASVGSLAEINDFKKPSTIRPFENVKSKIPSIKVTRPTKVDTPRYRVDLKKTVEMGIKKSIMLRSATTSNLKPSALSTLPKPVLSKQRSALNLKK